MTDAEWATLPSAVRGEVEGFVKKNFPEGYYVDRHETRNRYWVFYITGPEGGEAIYSVPIQGK